MAGPDVGGSMKGQDPEKYGPIRSLLAYYAKKPHIFRSCVRDNRKRFGPRVNNVCAWVKDQIKGTTYWRGKEAELRAMMLEEGFTEADIQVVIYDSLHDREVEFPPSREMAEAMCQHIGVDYDPDGFDEACRDCGEWGDCNCEGYYKDKLLHKMKMNMRASLMQSTARMVEASKTDPKPMYPSGMSDEDKKKAGDDLKAADAEATKPSASASSKASNTSKRKVEPHPREVARPENGTVVYDDGSIKNTRTGQTKYPTIVYPDGSVRYDDGSVARPGSLASMLIMSPMTKEDRARLFQAGPAGLPMKDFASVEELINDVIKSAYSKSGGGIGEFAVDQVAAKDSLTKGMGPEDYAPMAAAGANKNLQGRKSKGPESPGYSASQGSGDVPMKPRRGEDVQRGPDGGRGVWRNVDGRSIFIKIGQTPNEAKAEQRQKSSK